ncbi:MAG: EF-hand domain-containing protein [Nitrosomonadales bacterium]|nr:EF-hand domain-containing protein [Nitrosomonadales bacterium]
MKKITRLAIVPTLALGFTLAHAEPQACHDMTSSAMSGQPDAMMFRIMDSNGDGMISKSEFRAFHDKRFKEMDANHDGKLSQEELQRDHASHMGNANGTTSGGSMGPGTTHLDERFNAADVNHDGGLDREEAKNMPMLSMYFDEVDTNKDGKVTRQEYFDAMPLLHRAKQEKAEAL